MNIVNKYTIKLHNFFASIMSIMFLVWFISGIVLIFAGFPHASKQKRFENLSFLQEKDFLEISNIPKGKCKSLELEKYQNRAIFRSYGKGKNQNIFYANNLEQIDDFSKHQAKVQAEAFSTAKLHSIDSINELDQWMPWSYYSCNLPLYKCQMNDKKSTVLYISAKTGSIVQQTNFKKRFLAYIGAIPHWIYIKSLRIKASLWVDVVVWLSTIGLIVSITGIFAGFIRLVRKKNKSITPYKKFWYKWHHILGFSFGIFVFTFILSGLLSLSDIPSWMSAKSKHSDQLSEWTQNTNPSKTKIEGINIWKALENNNKIRQIAWKTILNKEYLFAYYKDYKAPIVYQYYEDSIVKQSIFSKDEILSWAHKVFKTTELNIESLHHYDQYYKKAIMYDRILPVYLISFGDNANTKIYINPISASIIKFTDSNSRLKHWLYKGLHTFDFPFINKYEWLRKLLLIIVSIGGILVSITGIVLSKNYILKTLKKIK